MGSSIRALSATLILITILSPLVNQCRAGKGHHFRHLPKRHENRIIKNLINQINNVNYPELSDENKLHVSWKSSLRKPIVHDPRVGLSKVKVESHVLNKADLEIELMRQLKLRELLDSGSNRLIKDSQPDRKAPKIGSAPWTLERSRPRCRNFIAGVTNYWFVCSDRRSTPLNEQLILSYLKDPTEEESLRMLLDIKGDFN